MAARRRVILISISGIDGSGKTTLINLLRSRLIEAGAQVAVFSFWERVAALSGLREFLSHCLFRGGKGVGSPANPVDRRDKNIQTWYMAVMRRLLYLLDAARLRLVLARARLGTADVAIFDRYIYDELANLSSGNWFAQVYVRLVLKLAGAPDIAYLLDADPVCARARKPEYPLEFLHRNRASYLALGRWVSEMVVIGPLSVPEDGEEAARKMLRQIPLSHLQFKPAMMA